MKKMKLEEEIKKSKESYSKEWDFTSKFYEEQGYYSLLKNKLPQNNNKIIEIGSGNGYSTLELSKISKKLISIDENSFCINNTFNNLKSHSVDVGKNNRGTVSAKVIGYNNFSYEMINTTEIFNSTNKVICIEGDILTDNKLITYLKTIKKVDVITCWMIGAHGYMLNEKQQNRKGRNGLQRTGKMVENYKLDVLNQVAKLSAIILQKNGILSIAERINPNFSTQELKEIIDFYNKLIKPYGYTIKENIDITIIRTKSKMKMVSDNIAFNPKKIGLLYLEYIKN